MRKLLWHTTLAIGFGAALVTTACEEQLIEVVRTALPAGDAGVDAAADSSADVQVADSSVALDGGPGDGSTRDGAPALDAGRDTGIQRPADAGPTGELCWNPQVITVDANGELFLPSESTVNFTNNYSALDNCMEAPGRDKVYQVTVPRGKTVVADMKPVAGYDPLINLVVGDVNNCEPELVCQVGSDRGSEGEMDGVAYTNEGTGDKNVFLIVDKYRQPDPGGSFSLAVSVKDSLPGEACENAEVILPGVLTDQTTVGYGNNYGNIDYARTRGIGCISAPGGDRIYAIDVPAGQTLDATVAPDSLTDLGINLVVGDCNSIPHACVDGMDDGYEGEADSVAYLNDSPITQTVYIQIDSYRYGKEGTFSLLTSIRQ
jgi:hypothetical protein